MISQSWRAPPSPARGRRSIMMRAPLRTFPPAAPDMGLAGWVVKVRHHTPFRREINNDIYRSLSGPRRVKRGIVLNLNNKIYAGRAS